MELRVDTNTGGAPPADHEPMAISRKSSVVSVPTPTRDLSMRQGAFMSNILRLEQSAERMSESGSDIGEEIRRMNEAERQRSRQNSIQSSNQGEFVQGMVPLEVTRSRNSSHRWGAHSYMTSPVGSVRSHASWSASTQRKPSVGSRLAQALEPTLEGKPLDSPLAPGSASIKSGHSISRQASQASRMSESSFGKRYDQIAEQIQEHLENVPPTPPRDESPAMFEDYQHEHSEQPRAGTATPPARPRSADTFQEAELAFKDFDGVHFSPGNDELVEMDEEGNEVRRVTARNSSCTLTMEAASLLQAPRPRPLTYAEPPPEDGMVYYPAPVPRMLNLPKRLSQLPSASVQAKRRTLALGQLQEEAKRSAPWLSQTNISDSARSRPSSGSGSHPGRPGSRTSNHPRGALNERMSMANMHNLPPQLRASVYWDHESVPQDVEIKSESAVATLDNILAASVTAPVSAFTYHPFAGDVKSTYASERPDARRSTVTLVTQAANAETPEAEKLVKKRPSSFAGLLRRNSSGDELSEALKKNGSRSSMLLDFNEGGKKLQKRKSQMSLGTDLDRQEDEVPKTSGTETDVLNSESRMPSGSRPATAMTGKSKILSEGDQIKADFQEEAKQEDVVDNEEEGEASFVQPSTLLAELQVRKAQQKTRNRTAVTAYPNGMHSTLLQLDAVAEINKRKRQKQRIALAWEDPSLRQQDEEKDEEDEDVPLGVLFPSKNGLINRKLGDERDWSRPLGLMERRELEENEPLASRRSRLQGGPALGRPRPHYSSGKLPNGSQLHLAGQPDAPLEGEAEEEDENEGETLAQRLRRLRTKSALDTTLDFAPKDGSRPVSTWTDDMLSQFGGLDTKDKDAKDDAVAGAAESASPAKAPTPVELENETLGQRRARLQREREANGGSRKVFDSNAAPNAARPGLRNSVSMADLLIANPVSASRQTSKDHTPAQGTLLDTSTKQQERAKRQLMNTNMRSSSYGLNRALVDTRPQTSRAPYSSGAGLLGQQHRPNASMQGLPNATFNNGFGGMSAGMQTSASTPMFGLQQQSTGNYFASPTAGMQGPTFAPQPFNAAAYNALMGGAPMTQPAYGYPGQNMGMPYGGGMGMHGGINTGMGMSPGMGMGMMSEEQMSPQQRATIDRWRLSVAQ